MTSDQLDCSIPNRTQFNQMFIKSVTETIASLLGRTVSGVFTYHMQTHVGISLDAVPNQSDAIFSALRNCFGASGDRVGKYVVKRLYQKADVPFVDDGQTLIEYVETLEHKLLRKKLRDRREEACRIF